MDNKCGKVNVDVKAKGPAKGPPQAARQFRKNGKSSPKVVCRPEAAWRSLFAWKSYFAVTGRVATVALEKPRGLFGCLVARTDPDTNLPSDQKPFQGVAQRTLDTYLQHFGLEKSPFSLTPDPQFLFLTPQHREALAGLVFGVTARKGFMVMTGEAGTGKTTLIKKLLQSFSATSGHFSVVINPALSRSELLECILMDFGVEDVPSSKALRLYLFKDMLIKGNLDNKISVLVVDEAHLLGPDLIEEIRLLSNFETAEQKLLQIVLVGQKQLNNILNLPSMTQVRQRIAIRMQLDPLDRSDIERYLRIRWARAGARHPLPFSADGVESIARLSAGVPRLINAICDAALINAYGSGKKEIRSANIAEVSADLQLIAADFPQPIPNSPPRSSGFDSKTAEIPVPAPGSLKAIQRYMPRKRQRRKLLSVTSWFRFAHTEAE